MTKFCTNTTWVSYFILRGIFVFDILSFLSVSIFDWIYTILLEGNSPCSYPAILRSDMSFTIETFEPPIS